MTSGTNSLRPRGSRSRSMAAAPTLRARAAVLGGCVVLALITGCSGSGGSHTSASSPPSTSTTKATAGSPSAKGRTVRLTIDNFAFHPASLHVPSGALVTVTDQDTVAHTVTSTGSKAFDTGDIQPGKSATFTAPTKAGTYPYHCTIHPYMKGTLTVG